MTALFSRTPSRDQRMPPWLKAARRSHFRAGPSRSGWTVAGLAELRELMSSFRGDLAEVSDLIGRPRREVNQALNALLGRTPEDAFVALEAQS